MATFAEGKYEVEIVGQGFGESKEKRTPYFYLQFVPRGRINIMQPGAPPDECPDYVRDVQLWLTDKTVDRTVEVLRSLGWQGTAFSDLDPVVAGHHNFTGVGTHMMCEHRQEGEKVYEDWRVPSSGAREHTAEDGLVRRLDALFGASLKSGAKAKSVKQTAEPAAASPDDIPF